MDADSRIKSIKNPSFQQIFKVGYTLTQPSERITEPGERRNARLLSLFLLSMFGLFLLVNFSYSILIPDYSFPLADLIGYGFIFISYLISRSRYAKVAAILMIIMFPMNIYMNIWNGTSPNIAVTLSFLIPSYVLASIWLSEFGISIYGTLNIGFILLLPFIVPETIPDYSAIIGPLAVNVVGAVLVIIAMHHRNQIELIRQQELRLAYDTTLEGWARALELRDKETEGHSQRVTDWTLRLSQELGVQSEDLSHIRRGAILHDIGKMGISDEILHKPGPLTPEEFEIVKRHPTMAYELLSPIPFLKKAVEIPYSHHEKWDGSGYPRGLKGKEIPLAARIFAVVDVWDALRSNRPYRDAWPEEKVLEYLRKESGKHFDPGVVGVFLGLLSASA